MLLWSSTKYALDLVKSTDEVVCGIVLKVIRHTKKKLRQDPEANTKVCDSCAADHILVVAYLQCRRFVSS